MAFPDPETVATKVNGVTVNHTSNLPSGIVAGETLIAVVGIDQNITITDHDVGAVWNEFFYHDQTGQYPLLAAYWRKATGSDTFSYTTQFANESVVGILRYSGAADPAVTPPQASAEAHNISTAPNSLSLSPTGGSKDYAWISACSIDANPTINDYPFGYDTFQTTDSNGTSGGVTIAFATKQATAASDDPDVFDLSATQEWVAVTIAVHPAAVTSLAINLVMAPYAPT